MDDSFLSEEWRTEFYDNNMNVTKSCPRCGAPGGSPLSYVDVIKITDKLSTLEGGSYSFFFGVYPRYPVLDQIKQSTAVVYGEEWDYVVVEGSKITIEAKVADPDEDDVEIRFSGWKQDSGSGEKWDTTVPGCEDMDLDEGKDPYDCINAV